MLYSVAFVVALCAAAATGLNLPRPSATVGSTDEESSDLRRSGSVRNLGEGSPLTYNFKADYESLINPANETSEWRWATVKGHPEAVSDSATFVRPKESQTIDFVSVPFKGFAPVDNERLAPIIIQYEGLVVNKKTVHVEPGQQLAVNVKFSCKTVNNEDNPLAVASKTSISKPEDDPSLAACGFGILSSDDAALGFSMVATNNGVWALYERNRFELQEHPERNQREFTTFKRLADRSSPQELVDGTIVYDRAQGKVIFMINGRTVYTLSDLGTLNQAIREDPAYGEVYTKDRADLKRAEPENIQAVLGLTQYPDVIDPNNPSNPPIRTSRVTNDPKYYDPKAKFEDEAGLKRNIIWGAGAQMTLRSAKIELGSNVGARTGRLTTGGQDDAEENKQQ